MADKKMLIVRQKQKSRKPSKTRLSALYPVFLSGFEPLAFRLGGKSRLPGYPFCNGFVTLVPGFCIFSVTIIETSSRLKLVITAYT